MSIRGRFVWEELMTTDVSSAATFYNKVAGLKTLQAPFDPKYTMFQGSNGNMGGVMLLPGEAKAGGTPPMWMSYIGTPNTDEAAKKLTSLGGRVHKAPWTIADGGRIAIVADPQGAVFALYSNPKATDAPPHPQLGHASWHELATTDHTSAFSFYQNLLGWHVTSEMDMGPGMGVYRMFAPDGLKDAFGAMYTKPPQQPGPPAWLPYIKVANVKAATDAAKKMGATIFHGPAEVPGGGWITMGADPQGAAFAIHATPAAPAAKKSAAPKKAATRKAATRKTAPKKKSKPAKKKAAPKKKSAANRKVAKKRKAGSKK
jgi:predicted enzyme related to lactoylglutathione lyase